MRGNSSLINLLQLNFAVLLISTSGALGRFIELPVPLIIALRACLGSVPLFLFCKFKGLSFKIQKKDRGIIIISSVLMATHWIAYFISLKLSTILEVK